jgi:hypothetical protein
VKRFVRPVLIAAALAGAAVGIALAVGRSAATGLYVVGAVLLLIAFLSRGEMVIGAYGEHLTTESIRRSNSVRAAYLFFGIVLIALGVLVETLTD